VSSAPELWLTHLSAPSRQMLCDHVDKGKEKKKKPKRDKKGGTSWCEVALSRPCLAQREGPLEYSPASYTAVDDGGIPGILAAV
jgi:hypothetical protein